MSENTSISWTDHTFNPWTGCTKVSPGCANCYAEGWAKRSGIVQWGKGKPRRRTSESNWRLPIKWNKAAEGASVRPRVFCASLADWLDDEVPIEWLADLLDLIRRTPNLDWLLLTKRPENWYMRMHDAIEYLLWDYDKKHAYEFAENWRKMHSSSVVLKGKLPSNVWIGTTVEDQKRADERIPALLSIPSKVRFLSCEPMLEAVDLRGPGLYAGDSIAPAAIIDYQPRIDWVIAGGESGPGFRPFDPEWARSLRDQCKAAHVAFHMKQMGGLRPGTMPPIPDDLMIREWPKGGSQ